MPSTAKRAPDGAVSRLPLSALLSQTLVAFTIECDNEFERQMPHRTSNYGAGSTSPSGPWLVSIMMWWNCMRFVGESGIPAGELERRARTTTNLNGMQRWRYVTVDPDPADKRPKPPRAAWLIRATSKGRQAQEVWQPLPGAIESRWRERFGQSEMDRLREALAAVVRQIGRELPDCLPILRYGLFSLGPDGKHPGPEREAGGEGNLPLPALLSRALLAFAMEFERESELSLAIAANVVRVLNEKGVLVRDIPFLSGVSKEAVSMAMGILQKMHLATIEPDPAGSRAKIARLTARGREVQEQYHRLVAAIEAHWQERFGKAVVVSLREALERLAGEPAAGTAPLFQGLEPFPDGWRASARKPGTLPHYPMVLHRGGFPDGS